jgi:hypothetical protein
MSLRQKFTDYGAPMLSGLFGSLAGILGIPIIINNYREANFLRKTLL